VQMMEFGRTPRRLFRRPHPPRRAAATGAAAGAGLWRCLPGRQLPPAAPRAANPSRPEVVATARPRDRSLPPGACADIADARVCRLLPLASCRAARTAAANLCAAVCVPAVAHAPASQSRRCGRASRGRSVSMPCGGQRAQQRWPICFSALHCKRRGCSAKRDAVPEQFGPRRAGPAQPRGGVGGRPRGRAAGVAAAAHPRCCTGVAGGHRRAARAGGAGAARAGRPGRAAAGRARGRWLARGEKQVDPCL